MTTAKQKQYDRDMNRSAWVPNHYITETMHDMVSAIKNTRTHSAHDAVTLTTQTITKAMRKTVVSS